MMHRLDANAFEDERIRVTGIAGASPANPLF
jgi:hypothetical protein